MSPMSMSMTLSSFIRLVLRSLAAFVTVTALVVVASVAQDVSTPAAKTTAVAPKLTRELDIPATQVWTDTGIDIAIGERVVVESSGQVKFQTQFAGPQGVERTWSDLTRSLPVNGARVGSVVGRIGDGDAAIPFAVGANKDAVARRAGHLFLGVNQATSESGDGSFHAKVQVFAAGTTTPLVGIKVTDDFLKQIPRRIGDLQGNPGDMVNFIIIGSQEVLTKTYGDAGWMLADKNKKQAIFHALTATLDKDAYLAMPMSPLYLFGRVQDFGFEHAEPVQMVQQRHHLRIWKAPLQIEGHDVWVGAATHDIGFEKDQRNNGLTHKIDPDIDKERDYLGETLDATGEVAVLGHVTPSDPLKEAHTATGGSFHSDGQILVVQLQ
jgi:LssY C-terminus